MQVRVENLSVTYAQGIGHVSKALDDVSFTVNENEFLGVIGHTGSGKSTLMQCIDALIEPDEGKIYIDDIEITSKSVSKPAVRQKVGLVFQYPEYQLFEETAAKDVGYGPRNLDMPEDVVDVFVKKVFDMVSLDYEKIKDKSPFSLSGGEKRRVAIAGVLVMKPKVLILDEPTAGIDPAVKDEILGVIQNIHKKYNTTIIMVSHNMDDIFTMSDRILVMDKGKLAMIGTPDEIFKRRKDLQSMNLEVPQAARLLASLREKGIDVRDDEYTVDGCIDAIYDYIKSRRCHD